MSSKIYLFTFIKGILNSLIIFLFLFSESIAEENLTQNIVLSLRDGKIERLEPFLARRKDYVYESEPGASPPSKPEPKIFETKALEWEHNIARKLDQNILKVRLHGDQIGVEWDNIKLTEIFVSSLGGSPVKYEKEKDQKIALMMFTLASKEKRKTITIFVRIKQDANALKLLGEVTLSSMGIVEWELFRKWQPGFDVDKDLKISKILTDSYVPKELFLLAGRHGLTGNSTPSMTIQLPASFQKSVPDIIVCSGHKNTKLIESGNNTWSFFGNKQISLSAGGDGGKFSAPLTLIIRETDPERLLEGRVFYAEVNGKKRKFIKSLDKIRTFYSPGESVKVLASSKIMNHSIKITFSDNVVHRIQVGDHPYIEKKKNEEDSAIETKESEYPIMHPNKQGKNPKAVSPVLIAAIAVVVLALGFVLLRARKRA